MSKKRGSTCRIFRHGSSYVMSLPNQLVKSLEINKHDPLVVRIDENGNLIVENTTGNKDNNDNKTVHVRVIGGSTKLDQYVQFGFTIPMDIAKRILNTNFNFPIIEEKKGRYFRLIFKAIQN